MTEIVFRCPICETVLTRRFKEAGSQTRCPFCRNGVQVPIQFSCSSCKKSMQLPASYAGKTLRCIHCEKLIVVPNPANWLSATIHGIVETIKNRVQSDRELTFLLAGRTGVGKSSTINSLFNLPVAKTAAYKPGTDNVQRYSHSHDGIKFAVVDTPGLCDNLPETGNDERYLKQICSEVKEIDSFWYVTPLNATRVELSEMRGIQLLTKALGPAIWNRCVIVFTFADLVEANKYREALAERTKSIRDEIAKHALDRQFYVCNSADLIPSVAVSNKRKETPDGKPWLGQLFTIVFTRFSEGGMIPFLNSMKSDLSAQQCAEPPDNMKGESNHQRKAEPRIKLNPEQKECVQTTLLDYILKGASEGLKHAKAYGLLGKTLCVVIGGAMGGFFGWLFDSNS